MKGKHPEDGTPLEEGYTGHPLAIALRPMLRWKDDMRSLETAVKARIGAVEVRRLRRCSRGGSVLFLYFPAVSCSSGRHLGVWVCPAGLWLVEAVLPLLPPSCQYGGLCSVPQ